MDWVRILAYITGTVDQELLLRNEYLAAENRILKAQLKTPLRLTDAERMTLAEIAHRMGRKALEEVANAVKPDTLLGWHRRLIARKFDGSQVASLSWAVPELMMTLNNWVVRMAKENSQWGYDRIVGAMANLGYTGYPIKRLAIFCSAMVFRLHRSASAQQRGPTSSVHICPSLRVPTFSLWRY